VALARRPKSRRVSQIKAQIEETTSDYDREELQVRRHQEKPQDK
jgi:hypothetical protein